jgi:ABC-type Fe3+/spermidine/putrescine transport system ATPase subunit
MSTRERSAAAGIVISGLRKSFGAHPILRDVDLAVAGGQFLCLLGPSGCGKTTLLRAIAGLDQPDAGRIDIGGVTVFDEATQRLVPAERRGLGMVFQHYALWPHMRVFDNIAYPLRKRGMDKARIGARVSELAELIGLGATLDRQPGQLSGGQQQRVALARALAAEPAVVLLDEPLSNLDASLRSQLRRELRNIHERLGMTVVMVTHDQEEAVALADVVAVMQEGRVVQAGAPVEILERPRTRYVAGFVGYDNFIPGILRRAGNEGCVVEVEGGQLLQMLSPIAAAAGAAVTIAVQSDKLQLHATGAGLGNMVAGSVTRVTRLGRHDEVEVATGGGELFVRRPVTRTPDLAVGDLAVGDPIALLIPNSAPVLC